MSESDVLKLIIIALVMVIWLLCRYVRKIQGIHIADLNQIEKDLKEIQELISERDRTSR